MLNKILVSIAAVAVIGTMVYVAVTTTKPGERASDIQIIGGDKDAGGCLVAAGYSWCEAKKTCIRQWEEYCTAAEAKKVTFSCADEKSISATFYPSDDKFVDLKLSDERNLTVPRAMSGSGARYAKADESFVFWNKGDTAFITEGASSTETFKDCVLK